MAYYELRQYERGERVWVGRYENLRNLSHWHYDCELVFVEKGRAKVHVGRQTFELGEGRCVFIDSGEIHSIEAENESLLMLFLFDENITGKLFPAEKLASPLLCGSYDVIGTFDLIERELDERKPYYIQKTEIAVTDLMIEFFRGEKTCEKPKEAGAYMARYKKLLVEIEEKYAWYTFSDAADFMNVSEHYFSGLFHKMSGMTFSKYINNVKIHKAVEMLWEGGKPITEISIECGFNTIRHFNRMFKEITGYSPSELPAGYRLSMLPVKDVKRSVDPTLEGSKLI